MMDAGARTAPLLAAAGAALAVWAADFAATYALVVAACVRGFAGVAVAGVSVVALLGGLVTAAAAAAVMALLHRAWTAPTRSAGESEAAHFARGLALGTGALSLIAILWNGMPILWLTPCR